MTTYCREDKILGRQDQSPGREQKEIKPTYRKKFPKLSCEFQLCGWVLRVHSCYHGWKALQLLQSQNQENIFHKNREISFLTMKKKQHTIKKKKKSMTDKPANIFSIPNIMCISSPHADTTRKAQLYPKITQSL